MDAHVSYLGEVCRVGGRKFATCTQKTRYPVASYKSQLEAVHGIKIDEDDAQVHPHTYVYCARGP